MRSSMTFSFFLFGLATLGPASGAETWRIDPGHSSATFSVRHLVVSTVRGAVPVREGSLTTDGSAVPVAVSAVLDATKIDTKNDNRDGDLRGSDWFDTAKYPTITFKSTKVTPGADASSFTVTGDLTIHGITKSVTLAAKSFGTTSDARGHKRAGYEATATIDRRDFGLNWAAKNPAGDLVAGNSVDLTLDVEAVGGN
jgi:polyisoprenoid-binding protein YceI